MNVVASSKTELEKRIEEFVSKDNINNCDITFVYSPCEEDRGVDLYVVTFNPKHNHSFLFGKSWGLTEHEALKNFVRKLETPVKDSEDSFTVTWQNKSDHSQQVSYFTGSNIYEILDKFYYDKIKTQFIIFSITLNPIS